jgi:uncharacterized protein (TIGR04562 family)
MSSAEKFDLLTPEQIEKLKYKASFGAMARAMRLIEKSPTPKDKVYIDEVVEGVMESLLEKRISETDDTAFNDSESEQEIQGLKELIRLRIEEILLNRPKPSPQSMLDLKTLGLIDNESINNFLATQEIHLDNPADVIYILEMIIEAIEYLRDKILIEEDLHELLEDLLKNCKKTLDIFKMHIRELEAKGISEDSIFQHERIIQVIKKTYSDPLIYQIFKWAGGSIIEKDKKIIQQSCGVLRIMAAINFIERHSLKPLMLKAHNSLKEKIYSKIKDYDPQGRTKGDLLGIQLREIGDRIKGRDRTIGKLLRSVKYGINIPADLCGIHFITETPQELLRLIYRLFFDPKMALFDGTSIRIDETKNLMFNPQALRALLEDYETAYKFFVKGENIENFEDILDNNHSPNNGDSGSPYSSKSYRAVHIISEVAVPGNGGIRKYEFPWEAQFMDKRSYQINEGTHEKYAERQKIAEQKRVLGNTLADDL